MVLSKLGRKDYLIAAHLALELCQLVIVTQMMMRDNKKNTNIHRFGDEEDVPVLRSLLHLKGSADLTDGSAATDILSALFLAAEYMDKVSVELGLGYVVKSDRLREMERLFS